MMTVSTDPVIMYQAICPKCGFENLLYRDEVGGQVDCINEECFFYFVALLPDEETAEVIFDGV